MAALSFDDLEKGTAPSGALSFDDIVGAPPEPVGPTEGDIGNAYGFEVVNDNGVPSAVIGGKKVPLDSLLPREGGTMVGELTPERVQGITQQALSARTQQASAFGDRVNPAQFEAPTQQPIPAAEQAQLGRLENARNEFARSAFSATLQPAQALSKVDEALFERSSQPRLGEMAQERSKLFQDWQTAGREAFPTDPRYQGEFLASTLPGAAGSQVPFLLSGNVGGAGTSALAGALMTAQQEYDAAKAAGASEETARKAGLIGLPIGLSEGIGGIGKGAEAVHGGFKGWLHSIAEENLQELGQNVAQQLNASYLTKYDPNKRMTGKDILDTIAATTVLTGAHSAIPAYLNRHQEETLKPGEVNLAEEKPVDLGGIDKLFEDKTAVQAAPTEVKVTTSEPTAPPLEVTPTHEASAKSLGADPVQLRQQEAVVKGAPIPELPEPTIDQIAPLEGEVIAPVVETAPEVAPAAEEPPFRKDLLSSQPPRPLAPEEQAVFDKAREELSGMKRAGKEGGSTTLPQIVLDAGRTIYRKGMEFAEWSAEMIRHMGEAIKPHLEAAWNAVVEAVNSTSPAGRRFKKSGSLGGATSDDVYSIFADGVHRAEKDTTPVAPDEFGEADKQAIRDAYQELQAEKPGSGQRIADVLERAGFPLSNQSKGLVMRMYLNGEITSLDHGDWSLSNNRTRAWGLTRLGEPVLRMSMQEGMKKSAPSPEGGAIGGQGGRRGGEATTAPSEEPTAVGIFNASTDAARVKMGLLPAMEPLRRSFPLVWDEAMKVIEQRPNVGSDLVTSLKSNPRNLTDVETAILAHERVKREAEFDQAVDAVNNASTEDEKLDAEARISRARDANQALFSVAESSGTKGGQELAARKILVNQDFSLARMEAETRAVANRGEPLSRKQLQDIKELHDALQSARDRIKELEEEQSKRDSQATFTKMMKELKSDRKEAVKQGKSVTDFLNEQADKARERLKGKLNQFGSAPDPTILVDLAIIGSAHIANGINTIGEFSAQMVSEFGDWLTPHLPDIFKQAQEFHESNKEDFAPKVKAAKTEPTSADLLKTATNELDPKLVFQLARAYVREGVEGADNVMQRVHSDLVKLIPDLTIREVRDAFSGYGKVTYPSKAADLVKLREYKVLSRLTSQLEDVQKKMAPLRTGTQRDKMGVIARDLQKRIGALMKQYGIQSTSPEQQLKSSIDAVKTRLRNEIEELDRAIATKTPRPSGKSTLQYDEEAKALRDQRDRKKAQYDAIFTPPGKTAEEKIAARLKALDQAVAAEAQLLREGILKRPPNAAPVTSPAIENKLMELDAMRQLRRELYAATQPKKAPEDIALEQAVKSAKESIKRLDEQLRTGNIDPKTKQPRFTPSQELEALWSERDAMRDALMELRKAQKPRTDPEERARKATIKALEKSVKNLEQRIFNKDFSPTPRKVTRPDTKEVAALRDLRDQMRKTFTDLKNAQTPVRSREEINLARDKKNIINRTKKLQEKIDKGNYAPEPKKDPAMDKEKRDLQFQYEKTREQYLRGVFEAGLKNEGYLKRGFRAAGESLNFSRAVMTGIDMSAVFRQGGMLAFAKPFTAAKALAPMFKAALSAQSEFETMQEIRNRPNYPLYKMAKLDFTEDAPLSLTKMEEQYASRWVQKLPTLFGGGLLRGSQRAYVTFLNRLRADSFDSMVNGFVMNGKPTTEEARAIANFINVATGRGALPAQFAGGAHVLNMAIFAPRYVLSRFQLIMGQPFWGGNLKTRAVIAGMYGRYLAGIATVLGLLAAWKDDKDPPIETDPRSTDFLKIRYGNTRLDPFSGLLQATTLMSRVGTQSKKTQGGQIVSTKAPLKYGQQSTWDTITSFLRSKLAPAPGAFVDFTTGTNVVGEPVSGKQALGRLIVPISFEDVNKVMQEQGVPKGVALSLLSLFGMGLNTYQPKAKSTKSKNALSTKL